MVALDPGKYIGLPTDDYFALTAANASSLKAARKSIAHMLMPRESRTAFDLGHAVHSLVLEGRDAYRERVAIRPKEFSDYRSKDARAWRDEQLAEGRTVLTREEADLVVSLAKRVDQHPAAYELLRMGAGSHNREVTYVWHDDEYDVPCKARWDLLAHDDEGTIGVDLKTTRAAHADDFTRSIVNFGYDLAAAHYREGFRAIEGRDIDAFCIIAVETEQPYGVAVYQIDEEWLELGAHKRDLAMEVWADWYHSGRPVDLPVYPETIQTLTAPRWA